MIKGIVLFDIKDFLYQGLDKHDPDIELINKKQVETLDILHQKANSSRTNKAEFLPPAICSHLP